MLNAKAYALSVRDDTSFRVEGGSGGYRIAKVTVNMSGIEFAEDTPGVIVGASVSILAPLVDTVGDNDELMVFTGEMQLLRAPIAPDVYTLNVLVCDEPIFSGSLITIQGQQWYVNVSGNGSKVDEYQVLITGDATIYLTMENTNSNGSGDNTGGK